MEVTEDNLIAAGYQKHSRSGVHQYADALFQKRIRDGRRTIYFVNIDQYLPQGGSPVGWGWLPSGLVCSSRLRMIGLSTSNLWESNQ